MKLRVESGGFGKYIFVQRLSDVHIFDEQLSFNAEKEAGAFSPPSGVRDLIKNPIHPQIQESSLTFLDNENGIASYRKSK